MAQTKDFLVSGLLTQPDGTTPVAGDVEAIITNDGAVSNDGTPFVVCAEVVNGKFLVNLSSIPLAPEFVAATGDTISIEFSNVVTKQKLPLLISGKTVYCFSRKLETEDIVANGGDANPKGKLDVFLVLGESAKLHTDTLHLRGEIFQPDASTPVPFGLQVFLENLTKRTTAIASVEVHFPSRFSFVWIGSFDTNDMIRMSVRHVASGESLPVDSRGPSPFYVSRSLTYDEIIAVTRDPNVGRIDQSFVLEQVFDGLLLAPEQLEPEITDSQVTLRWRRVLIPNLQNYRVYRSLTPNGPFFRIGETNGDQVHYIDRPLINGVTYFYKITSVDNSGKESPAPISYQQATPDVGDPDFSIRQVLNPNGDIEISEWTETPAGRDITYSFYAKRTSADASAKLTLALTYISTKNKLKTMRLWDDFILNDNTFDNDLVTPVNLEHTKFGLKSGTLRIPVDAAKLIDVRFTQTLGSKFIVDDLILKLHGNSVDSTARQIFVPSYNSDGTKIIVKNKFPGDLILFDLETQKAKWLTDAGGDIAFTEVPKENATDDPVAWLPDDSGFVYSHFLGRFAGAVNSILHVATFDRKKNIATNNIIADTNYAFFPKISPDAVVNLQNKCDPNGEVVYLFRNIDGTRAIRAVPISARTAGRWRNLNIQTPLLLGEVATRPVKISSIDIDQEGDLVYATDRGIFVNKIQGNFAKTSRVLKTEASDFVIWGNKKYTDGKLVAYKKAGVSSLLYEFNRIPFSAGLEKGTRAEYLLDTSLFPDGLLKIIVMAGDSLNQLTATFDQTTGNNVRGKIRIPGTRIDVIVNNSNGIRPMLASKILDPLAIENTNNINGVTIGITNQSVLMAAGISSATRGRLDFFDRQGGQRLASFEDTFTSRPAQPINNPIQAIAGVTKRPVSMRFIWLTGNQNMISEPGGTLNESIITVNTGENVKNIFVPQIDNVQSQTLTLFIADDGSTYYDPALKILARKATSGPLVKVTPGLETLPRFTSANTVTVKWGQKPGGPKGSILQYVLYRSTDPNGGFLPIFTTPDSTNLSFIDTNLVDGTAYFYQIEAIDILGNRIPGQQGAFTIIDKTGAIQRLGYIQVDLNIDDLQINESMKLEAGTGKIFSPRTTFGLNPDRNKKAPPITLSSDVFADYTFQKARDIKMNQQPVIRVDSIIGDISGVFAPDRDFLFIKDTNVESGSYKGRDIVRFIKQEKEAVEEEIIRGPDPHGAEALGRPFATEIESISMPIKISGEPVTPVAGFLLQLLNTEPGKVIDGKRQNILEITDVTNETQGISYQINDIVPNYNAHPALIQLDLLTNFKRFPMPKPTDKIKIDYTFLKIFPKDSYQLDRSHNSVRWLGVPTSEETQGLPMPAINEEQPREDQRYLVTYKYLAPIPQERLTVQYTTNALIQTLQFGDLATGVRGLNENRHICADVLARETNVVPVDVEMNVTLFDTADKGFATNSIINAVSSLFSGKKLGQGIRISDIACAVKDLPDVEGLKLDPFEKLGRTDIPTLLKIFVEDQAQFSVKPGRIEGEVTFFKTTKPTNDIIIPAHTIVSNDLNTALDLFLFEVNDTFTAPVNVIDTFFNQKKNRYEFKVRVTALFDGSATVNRKVLNTIGGQLRNLLQVENEAIIEGAIARQERITGNGTLTLQSKNGQMIEVLKVWNFSALAAEEIPTHTTFIKLKHAPISNARGNGTGPFTDARGNVIGGIGDSSLVLDDPVVFNQEVATPNAVNQPGTYYVNYLDGYIQTFTKTSSIPGQTLRYKYLEKYDLQYVKISDDKKSLMLYGPSNINKPVPQPGDFVLIDYRWAGDGVPLKYRLETFSNSNGVLDLSFLSSDAFNGSIFIGNDKIDNVTTHPEPPFYAYNKQTHKMSIVGRPLTGNEEILFQFRTPFGDLDLVMTVFDLVTKNDLSIFTFNVNFRTFKMDLIEFLEMGGSSVLTAPGVLLNAGLTVTKIPQVVVQLSALNAASMMLSEDRLFRDKTDLDFAPFSTITTFTFSPNDGQKTLWVKFRFSNPAIQDVIKSATITLDSASVIGQFNEISTSDFQYANASGLLRLPTSFGQSDIVINAMESINLHSLNVNIDTNRARRTF